MIRNVPLVLLLLLAACRGEVPVPITSDSPGAVEEAATAPSPKQPAATAVPEETPAALAIPARFRAVGTEPFWGAKVSGTSLVYSTPDFPDGIRTEVIRTAGPGSVAFTGTIDGRPLELTVSAGPCSDGMSDTIYPWAAVRTIGPDIARGCALED